MSFSYPNLWNACLLILRSRGYRLYLHGDPDETGSISTCTWNAEKDGIKICGQNPTELLGMMALADFHEQPFSPPYTSPFDGENLVDELILEWTNQASRNDDAG